MEERDKASGVVKDDFTPVPFAESTSAQGSGFF